MKNPRNQHGFALLSAIFFLVVVASMGVIFISLSASNSTESVNELNSSQALYIAEAGLQRAVGFVSGLDPSCPSGGCTCTSINTSPSLFSAVPLGAGQFTVTATLLGGQCVLTSTGGVPTIAAGTAQRVVTYNEISAIQDAWAVGYNDPNYGNLPVMVHWNGTTWTNLTSSAPNIAGANLMEVSMDSSIDGWAVSNDGQFIHYNGTSWSLSSAFKSTASLNSVYINSQTDGWAVGSSGQIDRLTASGWSMYTAYTAPNTLQGVWCMNTSFCFAVGNNTGGGFGFGGQVNINFWNGTTWQNMTATFPVASLRYVACVDTTHCWAVGNSGGEIVFYNGTTWTLQSSGYPHSLWGVDCIDSLFGFAVGRVGEIIDWNGTTWNLDPKSGVVTTNNLNYVSCASKTECWAVGNSGTILNWNGTTWSVFALSGGASTAQINSMSQFRAGNSAISWKEVFE